MSCAPKVLLLDEPTRGLDYSAKQALIKALRDLSFNGTAVVIASHDVELVAQIANRVLVLANGEVIATGNTRDILTSSVTFAPQVAKVLAPQTWLTVEEVKDALKIAG
jgi:energy-coupling factor transport system ATP-binding protein